MHYLPLNIKLIIWLLAFLRDIEYPAYNYWLLLSALYILDLTMARCADF